MNKSLYQGKKFDNLFELLRKKQVNGILYVNSKNDINNNTFNNIIVWENGGIVYANSHLNSPEEIAKKLLQKLNPKMAEFALKFARNKMDDSTSVKDYLSFLTKVGALKWSEVKTYIQSQVAYIIEQILVCSGTAHFKAGHHENFNFSWGNDEHSLNWSNLYQELQERQQKWHTLTPEIPALNAIVQVQSNKLATITQNSIREHIEKHINGKRSLIEIASRLDKDPLNIARTYYNWVKSGWITCTNINVSNLETENNRLYDLEIEGQLEEISPSSPISDQSNKSENLATILSVDDSLIVQTSIKRVLEGYYQLIFSDNAIDALQILDNEKIDLLLLDVTMPDIDGLKMCKMLRQKPQFQKLTIVMLTAKDNVIDKIKGKYVGADYYLTKPFEPDKFKEVIHSLLRNNNHS